MDAPVTETLTPAELEKVLGSFDIPPCPSHVMQVMSEAQRDEPDTRRLASLISSDVGMAAMTIKLANSPLFRGNAHVDSVPQAIARLGVRNIVCVVVAAALKSSMSSGLPESLLERFWDRASMIAVGSGVIAGRLYGISRDAAYTYALFHDAAIPVLMRRFKSYSGLLEEANAQGLPLAEMEMQRFQCDHAIVGALLARNWGLSDLLARAVRHHHDPQAYGLPESVLPIEALSLIAVTQVAEYLAAEILEERDVEVGLLFDRAVKHLGIGEQDLLDIQEELVEVLQDGR
ncbi:HDOD domain-containing protein [Azovibrio restrictus]|uniref:HDOD domain-containing protein n=1 Tax=Azovibrio restrictus TaxID=146938 RepID=UPI00041813B3|nr:HDOD domain-containing protein [Azovibrio restrictus]MCE1171832.1 HDOD domain-containing protein [Azovibrio sp.]